MSSSILALDVGGTSIKSGVVELDRVVPGEAAHQAVSLGESTPTRSTDTADVVVDQLCRGVESAMAVDRGGAVGLAIAFPGPFDVAGARALIRGLHKFESIYGLDLRAALQTRLGPEFASIPIEFARDSEAAGMGEAVFGAGRSGRRVLTVTIGTGLGACLTENGRVVEVVGDLKIEKLAQRATAGGRADDVLSARGLAARLGIETSAVQNVAGQPRVVTAIGDHGQRLGEFLAPVVDELGIDLVVVGGGLVNAFDVLGPALRTALGSTRCEPAMLGAAGPLLGAARLAFPGRFRSSR